MTLCKNEQFCKKRWTYIFWHLYRSTINIITSFVRNVYKKDCLDSVKASQLQANCYRILQLNFLLNNWKLWEPKNDWMEYKSSFDELIFERAAAFLSFFFICPFVSARQMNMNTLVLIHYVQIWRAYNWNQLL